jgi:hypothetical protein
VNTLSQQPPAPLTNWRKMASAHSLGCERPVIARTTIDDPLALMEL